MSSVNYEKCWANYKRKKRKIHWSYEIFQDGVPTIQYYLGTCFSISDIDLEPVWISAVSNQYQQNCVPAESQPWVCIFQIYDSFFFLLNKQML